MLQISTIDSEIYLFPDEGLDLTPVSALNADDEAFYGSIKEGLNQLSARPQQETINNILQYSQNCLNNPTD
jgi:hypothetical protein